MHIYTFSDILNLIYTKTVFALLGVKWKYEHCMSIQEMHSQEDKISKENWGIKEAKNGS